MADEIISREGLLLSYYQEREHFEHDEAVRRVASFTGQPVDTVESVIAEEATA